VIRGEQDFSCPRFRGWITGTGVIASIFGMVILGMAFVGAAGVTWTSSSAPTLELSAQSR
jgi:hypothetical protein